LRRPFDGFFYFVREVEVLFEIINLPTSYYPNLMLKRIELSIKAHLVLLAFFQKTDAAITYMRGHWTRI
jgi:hypothetical protein